VVEVKPALSRNLTVTVFCPSPAVRFQVFTVAYASQVDHVVASFEKHICANPETASDAEIVNVTDAVFVVGLVVMFPVGGVLSNLISCNKALVVLALPVP